MGLDKVLAVARNDEVGFRGIRTLVKPIVGFVFRNCQRKHWA